LHRGPIYAGVWLPLPANLKKIRFLEPHAQDASDSAPSLGDPVGRRFVAELGLDGPRKNSRVFAGADLTLGNHLCEVLRNPVVLAWAATVDPLLRVTPIRRVI